MLVVTVVVAMVVAFPTPLVSLKDSSTGQTTELLLTALKTLATHALVGLLVMMGVVILLVVGVVMSVVTLAQRVVIQQIGVLAKCGINVNGVARVRKKIKIQRHDYVEWCRH
jgi:hypothetical protein